MGYFVQQLISGLTLGSIYGLIAIGYTIVCGWAVERIAYRPLRGSFRLRGRILLAGEKNFYHAQKAR